MRTFVAMTAAILVGGSAPAADPAVPDALKPFQGYWRAESIRFDGAEQVATAQSRAGLLLVIQGTEYKTLFCTDPAKNEYMRVFAADLSADPATNSFELVVTDGQKKGDKRHGIYDLSGTTLRLCYGPADRPRPVSFDAPKGQAVFLETWRLDRR